MASTESTIAARITALLPNHRFMVEVADGRELQAVLSPGCTRQAFEIGQTVLVEMSPFDQSMCRIVPEDRGGVVVCEYG